MMRYCSINTISSAGCWHWPMALKKGPTEKTADGFGEPIERQIASMSVKACKGIIYPQAAVGALAASHITAAEHDDFQSQEAGPCCANAFSAL